MPGFSSGSDSRLWARGDAWASIFSHETPVNVDAEGTAAAGAVAVFPDEFCTLGAEILAAPPLGILSPPYSRD